MIFLLCIKSLSPVISCLTAFLFAGLVFSLHSSLILSFDFVSMGSSLISGSNLGFFLLSAFLVSFFSGAGSSADDFFLLRFVFDFRALVLFSE